MSHLLTVQADDAHRVATRREDWERATRNAAISDYADELAAALPWATSRPQSRAQQAADRAMYRLKVAEARARLHDRLGLSS